MNEIFSSTETHSIVRQSYVSYDNAVLFIIRFNFSQISRNFISWIIYNSKHILYKNYARNGLRLNP